MKEWEQNYLTWKSFNNLELGLNRELSILATDPTTLKEAFYQPLNFGTAGMRGTMGPGLNRMNIYTIRQATEGLTQMLLKTGKAVGKIVIGFDGRHHSREFAYEAAKIIAKYHFEALVFNTVCPTPELAFAVRYLKCTSGIMITASHNPKNYNGYKVYDQNGGQITPAVAHKITDQIRLIVNPLLIETLSDEQAQQSNHIKTVNDAVNTAFLNQALAVVNDVDTIRSNGDKLKVVYTPLHGVGTAAIEAVAASLNLTNFATVPEQRVIDPDFSTVIAPNPEIPSAFDYAIKLGKKRRADLVVATDPDADRLGLGIRIPNGDYQLLTGNQIAALLINYLLKQKTRNHSLPRDGVIVKSIVSTKLVDALAQQYHVTVQNELTGFKYVAEEIDKLERGGKGTFLFGFEESYGYLIKPFARDKDAVQTFALLIEMAVTYQKQGRSLWSVLNGIYQQFGYYLEKTSAVKLPGITGQSEIQSIMQRLRHDKQQLLAKFEIERIDDLQELTSQTLTETSKLNFSQSNVLRLIFKDESWAIIRPSGTEPKLKCYMGVRGITQTEAKTRLSKIINVIKQILFPDN
ncbi:phospho-sugar mutase [Lactiplantibacillus argentoratensis]|uniref:phospho-sugar mutase n=1 Tax=Lactiplantibacillus argentoratensis TaxID=271881 RepID=UPI001B319A6E|nr:phospho-sugar mutase [Lactiplantibacillus argentoratensis]MBP5809491.1 phospho-sugar mutase [Lactiplantibacillus argentoratensis]